jgi:sterol desaturase/sphingolipid hydroxylase (fatty acid hydroxylase superfamily)
MDAIQISEFFMRESQRMIVAIAISFLAPALVALVFNAICRRTRSRPANRQRLVEVKLNSFLFLLDIIFVVPALMVTTSFIHKLADGSSLLSLHSFDYVAPPLVAIATVFIGDFISYVRHRWEHSRFLWPAHAIHHSDKAMTWLTIFRFHPLNRLTSTIIDSTALLVIGFPAWAVVVNGLVRHYYGMFIHADLPWTYGFMGKVFVSPAMHRWHHVLEGRGIYSNYATVFSVFDRAFKTFYLPGPCNNELGISQRIDTEVGAQLAFPFKEWAKPWISLKQRARQLSD